ncbi:MAG: permease prefix domain 2-containing transporter [Saprospiraceae bacterium]
MKNQNHFPPKWADKFLAWFCAEDLLEEIQGDLHEAYHHQVEKIGRAGANRWYAKNVFQFFRPYAFEKYSRAKQFLPMFDNYYKIAIRNILHRKGFTAINMLGLTVGISVIMLIGLFLKNELTYDQSSPDHEQVFRVMNGYRDQIYTPMYFGNYSSTSPTSQLKLTNHLRAYDDVAAACHFIQSESSIGGREQFFVETEGKRFTAQNILYTNTGKEFQNIFPQKFLMGNTETAFGKFDQIILTEKLASKWFGQNWLSQDLIGKDLVIESRNFQLGGIIQNVPDNVHYEFDWIIHQDSIPSWAAYTYFKLEPESSVAPVIARLNSEADLVYPGYSEDPLSKGMKALPLADIHFTKSTLYELKPIANRTYLNTLGLVALVILLIILIN